MSERGVARHRLDAAHARGDGALGDHLEEPDLPRRVEVGAAAQLGGEVADPDDAHAVAVLLAEERHGPALERGLEVHLRRRDDDVGLDVLVDEVLDLLDLGVLDARAVREVEAQVIGRDERARLGHVGAEDAPERGVEKMRPRVMQPQPQAAARFDGHGHLLVFPQAALRHANAVNDELAAAVVGVLDDPLPFPPHDRARVAHLAARLGIGGGAVEDDLDDLALRRLGEAAPLADQGEDPRRRRQLRIAEELGLADLRRELAIDLERSIALGLGRTTSEPWRAAVGVEPSTK